MWCVTSMGSLLVLFPRCCGVLAGQHAFLHHMFYTVWQRRPWCCQQVEIVWNPWSTGMHSLHNITGTKWPLAAQMLLTSLRKQCAVAIATELEQSVILQVWRKYSVQNYRACCASFFTVAFLQDDDSIWANIVPSLCGLSTFRANTLPNASKNALSMQMSMSFPCRQEM